MTNPRKFVLLLAFAFGVPWLLLIVIPALRYQKLAPIPYDKDKDGIEGVYPGKGLSYRDGQLVYLREGCVQCHTQVMRPSFVGWNDGWRKGWGSEQGAQSKAARESTPRDYSGEPVAPLGIQRNGPDLANFGYRGGDRNAVHVQLYAPRAVAKWSVMPAFRHLYTVKKIEGNGSANALKFPQGFSIGKDLEVVPTADAEELVNYLLSLKKDAPVPGANVAEASKK